MVDNCKKDCIINPTPTARINKMSINYSRLQDQIDAIDSLIDNSEYDTPETELAKGASDLLGSIMNGKEVSCFDVSIPELETVVINAPVEDNEPPCFRLCDGHNSYQININMENGVLTNINVDQDHAFNDDIEDDDLVSIGIIDLGR